MLQIFIDEKFVEAFNISLTVPIFKNPTSSTKTFYANKATPRVNYL